MIPANIQFLFLLLKNQISGLNHRLGTNNKIIDCKLKEAGWAFPEEAYNCLSDYEKDFFELEFTGVKTLEYYKHRLRMLGYCDKHKVLDAACGMGQWSAALADLNEQVVGVDINVGRLLISKDLCHKMGKQNASFRYASMDSLPFERETFQGVFCYGAFMFSNMPVTLMEFNRVLQPGGYLYLNINMVGWYIHLLIDRGIMQRNFSMVRTSLNVVRRTLMFKNNNIIISQKRLVKLLEISGFKLVGKEPEGCICVDTKIPMEEPSYKSHHYGMPAVVEILAKKI